MLTTLASGLCFLQKSQVPSHPGFPDGLVVNNLPAPAGDAGDVGSIPGWGRSPGRGHDDPLQYSCVENPHEQRSLVGHSPRRHSQKWLSTCMRARTHTHTHTPHLRASALLSPVSAFCRVFHMLCPPLPGFWIYIFQRGLWQGYYLKWAHSFPSWSLLKHHLHLFLYPFSLEITRLWCASPTGMSAPWRLGDVCLLSCGIPSAGYRASLPNPLFCLAARELLRAVTCTYLRTLSA